MTNIRKGATTELNAAEKAAKLGSEALLKAILTYFAKKRREAGQ